jgi:hypothetical protein
MQKTKLGLLTLALAVLALPPASAQSASKNVKLLIRQPCSPILISSKLAPRAKKWKIYFGRKTRHPFGCAASSKGQRLLT